jgi:ubiquinone/menaquinone biosynthesis C-methylase UbiE
MPDVNAYNRLSRWLLGSLYRSIANDVAATAAPSGAVLEVGSGPGHLAIALARDHGLDVTGVDLDPEMVATAEANVARSGARAHGQLRFVVGDAAALPFTDGSFDLVVSTFSIHHWDDPAAGLAEIVRVLRPGGRALLWDIRPGGRTFHRRVPDPMPAVHSTPLSVVSVKPWPWPWRLHLSQRMELTKATPPRPARRRAHQPADSPEH